MQLWSNSGQGFLASDILSDDWRTSLQPLTRYRQYCDVEDAVGTGVGEVYNWTIFGDTEDEADEILENQRMPESTFPVSQGTLTMTEHGIAVPYTLKYEAMSRFNMPQVVTKTLKNNANKLFERKANAQFQNTHLRVVGGAAGAITLTDNGVPSGTNDTALTKDHVKTIRDTMEERNVPAFDGEDYVFVGRPSTARPLINDLEQIHQYTDEGWKQIINGERGRYEGIRITTATFIQSEGWTNGKSDAAYFFGADTVTEAIAIPEELRAKIPDDYGRSKGIAWYYIGAFGITHGDTSTAETRAQGRIFKWDSAA